MSNKTCPRFGTLIELGSSRCYWAGTLLSLLNPAPGRARGLHLDQRGSRGADGQHAGADRPGGRGDHDHAAVFLLPGNVRGSRDQARRGALPPRYRTTLLILCLETLSWLNQGYSKERRLCAIRPKNIKKRAESGHI